MAVDNSGSLAHSIGDIDGELVDMNLARLLRSLTVERYDNRWWSTAQLVLEPDNDITCARRRREMAADFAALDRPEREAR